MRSSFLVLILCCLVMSSCDSKKKATAARSEKTAWSAVVYHFPPVFIYKTTGDFDNRVPVVMNEDRTEIVSYPAPSDVVSGKPTPLNDGYLLDNRGINRRTAFLDYTYEEYASLEKAPSLDELKAHILEKEPFSEVIFCGSRLQYTDIEKDLNRLIEEDFPGCIRIED